jgi:hypothetical protein
MKSILKPVLMAGLLSALGVVAFAQAPMGGDHMMGHGPAMHEGMGRMDPAKMQAMMEKRMTELKALLKITAAQEGAWTTFTAAMKPPADMMAARPDPAEMAKLSTPERLDKMKSMRAQHMAAMDKREEAIKTFYAALTVEQKKTFDEHAARQHGPRGKRHSSMDGKAMMAPAK